MFRIIILFQLMLLLAIPAKSRDFFVHLCYDAQTYSLETKQAYQTSITRCLSRVANAIDPTLQVDLVISRCNGSENVPFYGIKDAVYGHKEHLTRILIASALIASEETFINKVTSIENSRSIKFLDAYRFANAKMYESDNEMADIFIEIMDYTSYDYEDIQNLLELAFRILEYENQTANQAFNDEQLRQAVSIYPRYCRYRFWFLSLVTNPHTLTMRFVWLTINQT